MIEKAVIVSTETRNRVFGCTCEVHDTPDPEIKIFRFKEGCQVPYVDPQWHEKSVRFVAVYSASAWMHDTPPNAANWDAPGEKLGHYRVTAKLYTPDGYVAAYEGTSKPEPKALEPDPVTSEDAERTRLVGIEDKIVFALEKHGRVVLSALKRKTHAYRFGEDWEKCLRHLTEEGEVETRTDDAGRVWVCTTSVTS